MIWKQFKNCIIFCLKTLHVHFMNMDLGQFFMYKNKPYVYRNFFIDHHSYKIYSHLDVVLVEKFCFFLFRYLLELYFYYYLYMYKWIWEYFNILFPIEIGTHTNREKLVKMFFILFRSKTTPYCSSHLLQSTCIPIAAVTATQRGLEFS